MPDRSTRLLNAIVLLAALGIVGGALALPVLTMTDTAEADVAVNDFAVPDHATEDDDVTSAGFLWSGGVSWSDTPEPVETVEITVSAETPEGDMQTLNSITCSHEDSADQCGFESSTNGSNYLELQADLILQGDWTSEDFTPSPGGEVSHTVEVMVETEVSWDGGSVTESASDTTTITVTHPDDGEADQSDPEAFIDFGTATVTVG